jgi:hypothetical protein
MLPSAMSPPKETEKRDPHEWRFDRQAFMMALVEHHGLAA